MPDRLLELEPYPEPPARPGLGVSDALAACAVVLIALARFYPFDRHPVVVCSLKALTGIPCLTCGMTRSWVHLAHGRVGEAFVQNPLGALLCLAAIALAALVALRHAARLPFPRVRLGGARSAALGAAGTLAVLLNWLYAWLSGVS